MKALGFDGRQRNWNLDGKKPKKNSTRACSKLHVRARHILNELFPTYRVLEEVLDSNIPPRVMEQIIDGADNEMISIEELKERMPPEVWKESEKILNVGSIINMGERLLLEAPHGFQA